MYLKLSKCHQSFTLTLFPSAGCQISTPLLKNFIKILRRGRPCLGSTDFYFFMLKISKKTNFIITIRYEIPTFSSVGPFFEEGV